MKEAKIFIVEDEPILVEQMKILLEDLGYWVVGNADNGNTAISRIISVEPDVIIMDISIKGILTGIDIGLELKAQGFKGGIIFLTSLDDDTVFDAARDVIPFDYLIKPVGRSKLRRTLELLLTSRNILEEGVRNGVVILKEKNELHKIVVEDIKYIEVQDKICLISIEGRKEAVEIRIGLTELLGSLKSADFIKVHRSYVVNENHIESYDITRNLIVLRGGKVPVSRTYKEELLKRLQ